MEDKGINVNNDVSMNPPIAFIPFSRVSSSPKHREYENGSFLFVSMITATLEYEQWLWNHVAGIKASNDANNFLQKCYYISIEHNASVVFVVFWLVFSSRE